MLIGEEVRCIIRIAYDLNELIKNFEVDENTKIEKVQISEIMGVELLDLNQEVKFTIRTCTDAEQFIIYEDFTQWIFLVTPLIEGEHRLTIKISVIELMLNKERKRNIVLEKVIEIRNGYESVKEESFKLFLLNNDMHKSKKGDYPEIEQPPDIKAYGVDEINLLSEPKPMMEISNDISDDGFSIIKPPKYGKKTLVIYTLLILLLLFIIYWLSKQT